MSLLALRYRCLVLDHDDTAVDSTASIHHPSFLESLRELRPDRPRISVEEFLLKSFEPGFMPYVRGELGFTEAEIRRELAIWRTFTSTRTPPFYPGMLDILREYRAAGGIVVVASHSEADLIERDYRANGDFLPDAIFGWNAEPDLRKPSPYPVEEALRRFALSRDLVIVVDDLKPGLVMARAAGVRFAAAGWGHDVPQIRRFMVRESDRYLSSLEELRPLLGVSP